jgi:hypothetical protein
MALDGRTARYRQTKSNQMTLTMSVKINGTQIRYQMTYKPRNCPQKTFNSATATLLLGSSTKFVLRENYTENMKFNASFNALLNVSCFDVKYGTVKSVQLYQRKNSIFCQAPVSKSLYSYGDGCVHMGPVNTTHSGGYCVLVEMENCFSLRAVAVPFHLQVQGEIAFKHPPSVYYGCGNVESPEGGVVTLTGTMYTDTANLVCNPGFQPVGPATSECQLNGTWTKLGYCIGKFIIDGYADN